MSKENQETETTAVIKALPGSVGSIPHVGKPTDLDPLQNVLYKNQYGTWTSIMVRALTDSMEWITSDELDNLLQNIPVADLDFLSGICLGAAKPAEGDSEYHLGYKAALRFLSESLEDIIQSNERDVS